MTSVRQSRPDMTATAGGFHMFPTCRPGLQAVAAASDHVFPRHTHDEYGIGLFVSGGQMSASGRGQITAVTGDIITVNPGEVHDGIPMRRESRSWLMLYLDPALVADIRSDVDGNRNADFEFERPAFSNPRTALSFRSAFAATTGERGNRGLALDQALAALFAPLSSMRSLAEKVSAGRGLLRARAMIDDEPARSLSLQDLATEAGLSRFQTLRAFQALTGLTPHAYLMQRRMNLARRRILQGLGLADAAAEAGYADQSHMTREFRRRYGLTPAAYRQAVTSCNSIQDA